MIRYLLDTDHISLIQRRHPIVLSQNFSMAAAEQFHDCRQKGIRVGTQDLRIACIALNNDLIVVTRNQQDFKQVPGLQLEDWSVEKLG